MPIESLLYDESPIVPIELARRTTPELADRGRARATEWCRSRAWPTTPPAAGSRAASPPSTGSAASAPAEPASLEALVGRALAATTPAAADPEAVTIEIGVLCYRGRAALERANAVRQQLADELARHGGLESIQPLLQELLDLVPLALAES